MTDKRYRTQRWKRVRLAVLRRDRDQCRIVEGCLRRATVADHIEPATLTMPDSVFFAMWNLRAGCHTHNTARGQMAALGVVSEPVHSLKRGARHDWRSRKIPPQAAVSGYHPVRGAYGSRSGGA